MDKEKVKELRKATGGYIKFRRQKLFISEAEMAGKLGVTLNTVIGIESGRFAWDIDMHIRICDALGITVNHE